MTEQEEIQVDAEECKQIDLDGALGQASIRRRRGLAEAGDEGVGIHAMPEPSRVAAPPRRIAYQRQAPSGLGVSAAELTHSSGGLKYFKPGMSSALAFILGNSYLSLPVGAEVLQIEGVWTYLLLTAEQYKNATGSEPPAKSAYEQIHEELAPGSYVLLDAVTIAENLEGDAPMPVVAMVVKDRSTAKKITDDPASKMAVAEPLAGADSTEDKEAGKAALLAVAAGGAAALVGGPLVGLATGAAVYLVAV